MNIKGYIITTGFYDTPVMPNAWRINLKLCKESEDAMPIKGLSDIRRLPRSGSIRLGIKLSKPNPKGKDYPDIEYPKEIDYFILDPATPSGKERQNLIDKFHRKYGTQPKQILIYFPLSDPDLYFPQNYKRYGRSTSLKCIGDGEFATCTSAEFAQGLKEVKRTEDKKLPIVECRGRDCIYSATNQNAVKRECSAVGVLNVILPELDDSGVWQITTGSFHSIVNVNSCIDYITAICGRTHMIPLILERRAQETTYEGKKSTHYMLHVRTAIPVKELQTYGRTDPTKVALEVKIPEAVEDTEIADAEPELAQLSEGEDLTQPADGAVDNKKSKKYASKKPLPKANTVKPEMPSNDNFFKFMFEAQKELRRITGNDNLYKSELSVFSVKVVNDDVGESDTKKQTDMRAYFTALLEEQRK